MSSVSLVEILREKNVTKRRSTLSSLFLELVASGETIEYLSVALARERQWQEKQLHVLRELKNLFQRPDLPKVCEFKLLR